ncbi:MAG: 3-dehydroquinate synthase [Candidatus Omnitrophica bacterium]|nr:3-dehydroquinate synthase [Candidatus Omnitrophota bacterium]
MDRPQRIRLNLSTNPYDIVIGRGVLDALPSHLERAGLNAPLLIVSQRPVWKHLGPRLQRALKNYPHLSGLHLVPNGEKSKSPEHYLKLLGKLVQFSGGGDVCLAALGGGVVGDLGGFAAASYRRGIPWVQLPTTLLAQVDSSIGGKTGLDLPQGKNLVGAIYQPRLVAADVSSLNSLPLSQLRSGMAEVIKYALLFSEDFFTYLEQHGKKALQRDQGVLKKIIGTCAGMKAAVVEEDEREQSGFRTLLNLGHTFAHAIENVSAYSQAYDHGTAVGLGLVCASHLAHSLGLGARSTLERVEALLTTLGLPTRIHGLSPAKLFTAQSHDKKRQGDKMRFVLPERIGHCTIIPNPSPSKIKATLDWACTSTRQRRSS